MALPADALAGVAAPAVEPEAARPQPTAVPPAAATSSIPVRTAARPPGAPAREVRSLEAEAGATANTGAAPVIPTRPPPAATSEPRAGRAPLPTATELMLKGELAGPPLNLDLHVYYPEPGRRVVFINGRKYREGERLASGPLVREIVADGVVLTEDGRLFLLQAE